MYFLSDSIPNKNIKNEKVIIGKPIRNPRGSTLIIVKTPINKSIKRICTLERCTFRNFDEGFSTGNNTEKRSNKNIKIRTTLSTLSFNKLNILMHSLPGHTGNCYYIDFSVFFHL
ncbi:hypothetical protein GYA37_01385 [candidate division WWE3 bacterium]|uniref:Uncharacterized protein n=1 Tax=candidate division WWE3 bacterium TaxID=2053526 RepID=A0A7X9E724_UNCKA|nr:hypothetical protein [candidate division WWE3 bacterium]